METLVIPCPECETRIKVPETALGKKVRCKACEHVFVAKRPGKAAPAKPAPAKAAAKKPAPPAKSPKPPEPAKKPASPLDDDEDEGADPYGMTEIDLAPRCPQCAGELESEDAEVCLGCGFNLKTREAIRTRRVLHKTGGDQFLWLLPGIICALIVVLLITYWCIHHFVLPSQIWDNWDAVAEKAKNRAKILADDKITGWYGMFFHPAFEGTMSLFFGVIIWKLGRFAFTRLVLHPTPPEEELR
jgi:predicted Zn finger-like uncharacterized protein